MKNKLEKLKTDLNERKKNMEQWRQCSSWRERERERKRKVFKLNATRKKLKFDVFVWVQRVNTRAVLPFRSVWPGLGSERSLCWMWLCSTLLEVNYAMEWLNPRVIPFQLIIRAISKFTFGGLFLFEFFVLQNICKQTKQLLAFHVSRAQLRCSATTNTGDGAGGEDDTGTGTDNRVRRASHNIEPYWGLFIIPPRETIGAEVDGRCNDTRPGWT